MDFIGQIWTTDKGKSAISNGFLDFLGSSENPKNNDTNMK